MRKRDIQSFTLKLNDLKEYEQVKAQNAKTAEKTSGNSGNNANSTKSPIFLFTALPKTKQEIRERIGMPME
uniref:CSON014442 protein n=1 Tax=Culicoides sonorensis TaxID=179676 RepID=A0A336K145_CULSO